MIDFIQLGANVGKSYSDIMWWLVPEMEWSGIFVEPNPDAYEKLIECYRIKSRTSTLAIPNDIYKFQTRLLKRWLRNTT